MITYLMFKDDLGLGVVEAHNFTRKRLGFEGFSRSKVIGTYVAENWGKAMQDFYDYNGYGKYIPMLDPNEK